MVLLRKDWSSSGLPYRSNLNMLHARRLSCPCRDVSSYHDCCKLCFCTIDGHYGPALGSGLCGGRPAARPAACARRSAQQSSNGFATSAANSSE